jgi:hypothetical protein
MNDKERAWLKINLLLVVGLTIPTGLVVTLADTLPNWVGLVWGVFFIGCWLSFFGLLTFAPIRFKDRFPARVRPQARMILTVVLLWMVGFMSIFLVDEVLPPWAVAVLGYSVLFLPMGLFWAAHFGWGPWGRELTDASKRDERESWRR